MHKLRWKHNYQIHFSMSIEKVSCRKCDFALWNGDNPTNQRTDLVHSIYMLLWSFWKVWAKSVGKVFLYNCLTRLCSQTADILLRTQRQYLLCLDCLLLGASKWRHIWKLLYSVASPIFLVIFSATVYQEVTILFSLTRWMETVLYSHVLCDIPVLRISLFWISGWKHS